MKTREKWGGSDHESPSAESLAQVSQALLWGEGEPGGAGILQDVCRGHTQVQSGQRQTKEQTVNLRVSCFNLLIELIYRNEAFPAFG